MQLLPNESEGNRKTLALSGEEWDDAVGYMQRITPRGDGETTYAETTKDGTKLLPITSPQQDGGGASLENLPTKAAEPKSSLVTGKAWNKMLDYLQMITPITEGDGIASKSAKNGFEISFPPLEETCDSPFYLDVTITGGAFPFTWAGKTWTESGQTKPICGSGTQSDSSVVTLYGYPYGTFAGSQGWLNSTTSTGKINLGVGGAGKGFVNPAIKLKKTNTPSAFTFYLGVYGYTFYGTPTTNLTTSNVASYAPAPASLFSQATSSRLTQIMFGSVTLTSGRVISWAPQPALEWDYDNPPT